MSAIEVPTHSMSAATGQAPSAWNAASGWMNLWIPTTAVVMGGLALAKAGYDKYMRWLCPLLAILFAVTCTFVGVAGAFE